MKLSITSIIAFLIFQNCITGQRNLTKEEIYDDWTLSFVKEATNKDSINIVDFDKNMDTKIHKLIDSLTKKEIDSIIVYSIAYLGSNPSTRDCITEYIPVYSFLIWKKNGVTKLRKLKGNCDFDIIQISSLNLFEYYDVNHIQIEKERFMPIILSGQIDTTGKITYKESRTVHEANYSLYYSIGKSYKILEFSASELEDKQSLFHDHNLSLKAYQWWQIIKSQIDLKKG